MPGVQNFGDGLLLTFYGDDVTGSTDCLEAAALAGIPAMVFLSPPSSKDLSRYPSLRVVGVAGSSRSRTPDWMSDNLPGVFAKLKALGAPICHYKTCSTFDSAPMIGSIGRAIEIGEDVFGRPVPVVVGVAKHRRYVVFSNLFAATRVAGGRDIVRIDRHPTMSRHPITPMDEADLRIHLARQTARKIASFDFCEMLAEDAQSAFAERLQSADVVILDTFDAATTRRAGQLLAGYAAREPAFVAGSSGVEYALFDHLAAEGLLSSAPLPTPCGPVDRIVALFGSCSPVTESQIAWAEKNGFAVIAADTVALAGNGSAAEASLADEVAGTLSQSKGVVVYTARGPSDPQIARTRQVLERIGGSLDGYPSLGEALGRVLRSVIDRTGARRVALGGGDSSTYALSQLGVDAFDLAGPLVPGAPLCRIHARSRSLEGVEIAFKGGQVGEADFIGRLCAGR
jgi:uncharacterized protein YgbK (DUF1537 family)